MFSVNVDPSDPFLDGYLSSLKEANGAYAGRTVVSSSSDPENNEQCAAYCELASSDCMFYHFDAAGSTCYAGMIDHTAGSWPLSGSLILEFHTQRLNTWHSGHFTLTATVPESIWDAGRFQQIQAPEGAEVFSADECGAYCHLDITRPCVAYFVDGTICNLLDIASGSSEEAGSQTITYNSGIMQTWQANWFDDYNARRWDKYIYLKVEGVTDSLVCGMHCKMSSICQFYVLYGGSCYHGKCDVTESIIGEQPIAVISFKDGKESL